MASRQIENRNFLSPTSFKFTIERSPLVSFFCNSANIPELNLSIATQPTYLKEIDLPGDKISFGDLDVNFLIDEDLKNYIEIQNWIRGLGYPERLEQYREWEEDAILYGTKFLKGEEAYSDGTLQILNSSNIPNIYVKFRGLFPYRLSTLNFDASQTDVQYFTAQASFKYTMYNITDLNGKEL